MSRRMSAASTQFYEAARDFAATIAAKFRVMHAVEGGREAQIVGPVGDVLKAAQLLAKHRIDIINESANAELRGRPDMAVLTDGLLRGYVELKAPGKGARPDRFTGPRDRAQWAKFKKLPNILYTDGTEWALYREGADLPVASVMLGVDITNEGAEAITPENASQLAVVLDRFFDWDPIAPKSPKELAAALARLCHYLRDDVEHAVGDSASNLSEVMREWRARLFPDADEKRFADAYAQTVAYALLLARSRGLDAPDVGRAVQVLEPAHGLLGQALNVLAQPDAVAEVRPAVDILFRYILAVDLSILAKTRGEPWLYFYEDFLAEYDPALRKDFGVYYTPTEVVQAQTALVSRLLQNEFGCKLGFASDKVAVLDPGAGTATYLLGVIERGMQYALPHGGPGYVPERATVMANNIYGFEWLVGPYAVAHLRLSEELRRHGATLPADGVHVFLTDTLESPQATPPFVAGLFGKRLSDEHRRALTVKSSDTPILVCIGNPPYDRHAAADAIERGGWIRYGDGQSDDNVPLRDFTEPATKAGRGAHLKNLYNSYVYFWRWALWKVFEQAESPGIVSFITASSYLRGPGFVGMREHMRRTFDELWILDLGGDNLGARKTPNVFAIQTPVAIAIGARYGESQSTTPARGHYTSLVEGTREEKLARLADIDGFTDLPWEPTMTGWHDPFLPQRSGNYWSWPLLTDLFPWQHSGVQMKRTWVIAPHADSLSQRWTKLAETGADEKRRLFLETRDRKITSVLKAGNGATLLRLDSLSPRAACPAPVRYCYRSLDRQWVIPDTRLGDYLRPVLWRAHSSKQVYLTSLLSKVLGTGPAAVVTALVPDLDHFCGRGGKDVIPLWRDSLASHPNLTAGLLEALSDTLGIPVRPEDFFAYCYAILSAPDYTDRFSEDLAVPGPRIPLTKDAGLFDRAVRLGRRLVALHTFGDRFVPSTIPQGKARIEKTISPSPMPERFGYREATATLCIGDGEVRPVSQDVWEFSVSGYKVLQRWLDFRMAKGAGRRTSELDKIRPTSWPPEWTSELLDLLWVLESTVGHWPEANEILNEIVAGICFDVSGVPAPSPEEQQPPKTPTATPEQGSLLEG